MKKICGSMLFASLVIPAGTFAAISGSNEIGLRGVSVSGDSSSFAEYRNIEDGVFGTISLSSSSSDQYLDLDADYSGSNDESFSLSGGKYGRYKYELFYDVMPHYYSYGNRTIYSGIGTDTLTYFAVDQSTAPASYTPNVPTDSSIWNTFDYGIERTKYGANINFNFGTPFYVKASLSKEERSGVKLLAAPSGVHGSFSSGNFSAFGQLVEMPEPVDYETRTLQLMTGYSSPKYLVELSGAISGFENENNTLSWRNPYVTTQELNEVNVLAPDNDYYKLAVKTAIRELPFKSTLAVKLNSAKTESEVPLLNTIWSSTGAPTYTYTTLGLNQDEFKGDVNTTKGAITLSSRPTKNLSTKFYYDYYDKDNDSSHIVYTSLTSLNTVENHLYEYSKHSAGMDVNYRLTPQNKLSGGYEYVSVDREREDFDSTRDHKLFAQLKNSSLDWATFKLKLQYMDRSGDFVQADEGGDASILLYQQRYDVADKVQTMAKVGVELYPSDAIDVGLEYSFKYNDYDETVLGMTEDIRHGVYADVVYRLRDAVRLSGYAGYEMVNQDSNHRQYNPGDDPNPAAGTGGQPLTGLRS